MSTSTAAVVVGVRSQFIKLAALLHLKQSRDDFPRTQLQLINTGQHYDPELTSTVLGDDWPDFDVSLRHTPGTTTAAMFAEATSGLIAAWEQAESIPAAVIVYGDGNPAAVGAIAASKIGVPVVHIEAGEKRGFHEQEEINRRLTDAVSNLHLCVSSRAVDVLLSEGKPEDSVLHVGDLGYPYMLEVIRPSSFGSNDAPPDVLVTLHRPENMDPNLVGTILDVAAQAGTVSVNAHPRLAHVLESCPLPDGVEVKKPEPYVASLRDLQACGAVITDSGGLIREAHLLNTPTVVRRDAGGWPNLADGELMVRCGRDRTSISDALTAVLQNPEARRPPRAPGSTDLLPHGGVEVALGALSRLLDS